MEIKNYLSLKPFQDIFSISRIYHENTKLRSYHIPTETDILNINEHQLRLIADAFKAYENVTIRIELPKDFDSSGVSIEEAILSRRSVREFSHEPISVKELSKLLYFTYGITGYIKNKNVIQPLRAAPSAGALYPLEIYLIILNAKDIEAGIYHYDVKNHEIAQIKKGDFREEIYQNTFNSAMVKKAAMVFIISAMFDRNQWKYKERGYRYILIDAGHLAENLYLMGVALGMGITTIGGFLDDKVNKMLDIDGVYETAIYLAVAGKKKK